MTAIVFCAVAGNGEARLGESLAELKKRFGEPIEDTMVPEADLRQLSFKTHDLRVSVTLIDGNSASEQYVRSTFKRDNDGKLILLPIPEPLANAILDANKESGQWNLVSQPEDAEKKFVRSDKNALALFMVENDLIVEVRLSTSEFNRHMSNLKRPAP